MHSRTSKLKLRCAFRALSEESGTRKLARNPHIHSTHGRLQYAQLAESFRRICFSFMEVLESKRTITCSAGKRQRQGTLRPEWAE